MEVVGVIVGVIDREGDVVGVFVGVLVLLGVLLVVGVLVGVIDGVLLDVGVFVGVTLGEGVFDGVALGLPVTPIAWKQTVFAVEPGSNKLVWDNVFENIPPLLPKGEAFSRNTMVIAAALSTFSPPVNTVNRQFPYGLSGVWKSVVNGRLALQKF